MKAAAIAASGLFAALLLTHCRERDPQAAALTDLSQRGYHLATDSFHLAAAEGDVAALDLFLRAGVSVDLPASPQEPGRTALRAAAEASQVEAFHWLLDHGASIDAADRSGTPLLSVAIEQGSEPLARALIERWPAEDPHTQEELLHTALQHDSPALWTLLLDRFDGPLDSSLLQAARIGQLPALDLLLRRGADPWSRDPLTAGTALHLAAAAGHAACVRYLIDRGADRFLLDANQHLAADVALENDHPDIADPLWTPPTPEEREIGVLPGTVSPDQAVRSLADFPAITPHEVGQPRVLLPLLQARIGRISGLLARPPAPQRLQLLRIRPRLLPLRLIQVEEDQVTLEDLADPGIPVLSVPGQPIGSTGFTLESLIRPSPAAASWATPFVLVRDAEGTHHALLPGVALRGGPLCAVIRVLDTDEFYEAHPGDTFEFFDQPGLNFTVESIDPQGVEIRAGDEAFQIREKQTQSP